MKSNMFEKEIKILIDLLLQFGQRGVPLDTAKKLLENQLKLEAEEFLDTNTSNIIQYALDNWFIDKIIDYIEEHEFTSIDNPVWFVKPLDDEGIKFYRTLPEVKKAIIKILRNCEDAMRIGVIQEEDLLSRLKEIGFDLQRIPNISNKVADSFTRENQRVIRWFYLVSQFELNADYQKMMDELETINERKWSYR